MSYFLGRELFEFKVLSMCNSENLTNDGYFNSHIHYYIRWRAKDVSDIQIKLIVSHTVLTKKYKFLFKKDTHLYKICEIKRLITQLFLAEKSSYYRI